MRASAWSAIPARSLTDAQRHAVTNAQTKVASEAYVRALAGNTSRARDLAKTSRDLIAAFREPSGSTVFGAKGDR